jgi:hypothetical protein
MTAANVRTVKLTADVVEDDGPNYGKNPPEISLGGSAPAEMNNNILRMYRDPDTGEFSHPVVYLEYGTHKYWPTDKWSYQWAPKHGGDSSYQYLTGIPPNLGEVEHPLTEEAPIILRSNGYWGAVG